MYKLIATAFSIYQLLKTFEFRKFQNKFYESIQEAGRVKGKIAFSAVRGYHSETFSPLALY